MVLPSLFAGLVDDEKEGEQGYFHFEARGQQKSDRVECQLFTPRGTELIVTCMRYTRLWHTQHVCEAQTPPRKEVIGSRRVCSKANGVNANHDACHHMTKTVMWRQS